ncbi:MAG TPA: YciI family protein [Mycobacteriales bacterium]|nr:YciI family protein [Mycobacteriales bacterium]
MKYLVMIYHNPASRAAWAGFSDAEKATGLQIYASLVEELAGSGELVVTEALADPAHGRRPVVAGDGPFAEVKEHLAGIFLVDCVSMERALEIAARIPEAAYGLVEVRPTLTYDTSDV